MHLHPQVINHYSDFFGNYFFAFSFYHLWMVCPVFAPVQSVPQHALVICFSLSINVRHTHTVVLKLYLTALSLFSCRYWAHGRLVWAFILCHHGIFSPALTSVLSKWLPTCSTLYWKVPSLFFTLTSSATFQGSIVILFCSLSVHFYSCANNSVNSLLTVCIFFRNQHPWLAIFLLTG